MLSPSRSAPRRRLLGAAVAGVLTYSGTAVAQRAGAPDAVLWVAIAGGTLVGVAGLRLAPRVDPRRAVPLVVVAGALFRLALVPTDPVLSTDVWHYLWDGRVQAAGVNPYLAAPESLDLLALRDDVIFPSLGRPEAVTAYQPLSQLVFAATWRLGLRTPQALKAVFAVADVAVCWLLVTALRRAGRDPRLVVGYAWHPLPVVAFAGSGHNDVLALLAVVAAALAWRSRRLLACGALLGVAGGLKLVPLLALPAFLRPRRPRGPGDADASMRSSSGCTVADEGGGWSWRWAAGIPLLTAAVLAVSALPYLDAGPRVLGYLADGYLRTEGYASGSRFALASALGLDGRVVAAVVAPLVIVGVVRSRRPAPQRAAWLLGAALALTTPYPWYAAALVALAVLGGAGWAWWPFALALEVAYASLFIGPPGVRLAEVVRVPAAGAVALAAIAALVGSARARRAVLDQRSAPSRPAATHTTPRTTASRSP